MTRPPSDSSDLGADRARTSSTDTDAAHLDALEREMGPAITSHFDAPLPDDLHERTLTLSAASRDQRPSSSLLESPRPSDLLPDAFALTDEGGFAWFKRLW